MIKNGGNGSFRVVFPLVRLVSSLQGFNSSGLRFLNFFNDPRIIREQRISAYKGYRGGGVVQGLSKEGYGARWKLMKVVLGVVVAAAEVGQQGHHVASFETKKWS
ncbi:hypothetical protein Tco_1524790 [Tanacetum coccineum]